jgi:hypothetical protein
MTTMRTSAWIRRNALGLAAIFIALTMGTAYATHPGGENTISTADIQNQAVTNQKIALGAVNTGRIADGAVTNAKIAPESITNNRIAFEAVNAGRLADGAVVTRKLADGAVNSAKVADNSLTGTDVADNSLTGTDVQESSLLGVNADKVDGGDLCRTGGVVTLTGTSVDTVCEQGGLRLDAVCIQLSGTAANATLRITTSVDDSFYGERGDSPSQDGDFDAADGGVGLTSINDTSMADPGVASQPASFFAGTPAGAQLSGTAGTRATLNGDGSATCNFVVGAIG